MQSTLNSVCVHQVHYNYAIANYMFIFAQGHKAEGHKAIWPPYAIIQLVVRMGRKHNVMA